MNKIITFLALIAIFPAAPLLAETPFGRELNQLQDQHAKAVAAAIEPLQRRYQVSLEQLLKRATQANDLDAALSIREQLTALSAPGADTQKYTPETLPKFLANTEWSWSTRPNDPANSTHVTFSKDGEFFMSGKLNNTYKVTNAHTLQLDGRVLKFSNDYKSFEVEGWSDGTPRYGERIK